MTNMMQAAVLHQFGSPLVIVDVPVPEPRADQILVKIAATGCEGGIDGRIVLQLS